MMPEVMVFGWPYSPLVGLTVSFCPDHTADSLLAAQVSCELSGAVGLVVAGLVHTLVLPDTGLNPVGTLAVSDTPECAVESPLLYHLRTRTVAPTAAGTCGDQLAPLSAEYSSVLVVAAEAGTAPIVTDAKVAADIAMSTPSATAHLDSARRLTRSLWRLFTPDTLSFHTLGTATRLDLQHGSVLRIHAGRRGALGERDAHDSKP
jgi:hypothetical protein